MSAASPRKTAFVNWPEGIPRRGLIVDTLGELIPFKEFMIKDEFLLLERTNPDPSGTRFLILRFDLIHSVKLIDALNPSVFEAAGYEGMLS